MRLTKTTSYAVRILVDCASSGDQLVKVASIAERLDISQLNVFKIVHLLSRAGFIEAVRGRRGGVRLARAADRISVGEVVRAMERTGVEVAEAGDAGGKPKRQINAIFDDALEAFIGVLDQHKLSSLAAGRVAAEPASPARRSRPSKPAAVRSAKRSAGRGLA